MPWKEFNDVTKFTYKNIKLEHAKPVKRTPCYDENVREHCCIDEESTSFGDCDNFSRSRGPASTTVDKFAASNAVFEKEYLIAWDIATNNGWKLKKLGK
jgi:hypothetical protein